MSHTVFKNHFKIFTSSFKHLNSDFLPIFLFYFCVFSISISSNHQVGARLIDPSLKSFVSSTVQEFWLSHRELRNDNYKWSTTPEIITKFGFPCETHHVITDDSYILTHHRIPYSNQGERDERVRDRYYRKPVALLVPGLFGCSDSWLANTFENNLPLKLSLANFDVWLMNPRGCFYSRSHKTLERNSTKFWNFSWHEMGVRDLPATIDYILRKTGQPSVNIVGISMGTTVNFVLLSERPEYNRKVNMSISLGPAVFVKEAVTPVRSILTMAGYVPQLNRFFPRFFTGGSMELFPRSEFTRNFFNRVCGPNSSVEHKKICLSQFFAIVGFDYCQFNMSLIPSLLDVYPSGASVWSLYHFFQVAFSGKFRQFDYGIKTNLFKYRRPKPPKYNLRNVQAPQILFWAKNDWMSRPNDVKKLVEALPQHSVKELCKIRFSRWNHFDYTLAKDLNLLVNERVLQVLQGKSCAPEINGNEHQSEKLNRDSISDSINYSDNDDDNGDENYNPEEEREDAKIHCPPQTKSEDVMERNLLAVAKHMYDLIRAT